MFTVRPYGEVLLSDKIITARKDHECSHCGGVVKSGTRSRTIKEAYDGKIHTYRACQECCTAMALTFEDSGAAIEARIKR